MDEKRLIEVIRESREYVEYMVGMASGARLVLADIDEVLKEYGEERKARQQQIIGELGYGK